MHGDFSYRTMMIIERTHEYIVRKAACPLHPVQQTQAINKHVAQLHGRVSHNWADQWRATYQKPEA